MRKLFVFLHASLDGMVEGPNGTMDIGWIAYNGDLEKYAEEILRPVDTVLWGRNTYLGMKHYWTSVPSNPQASSHEVAHAAWVDAIPKVVFSTTLEQVDWNNARLVKENVEEEIMKLKQRPGGDMIVLGSPRFAHVLLRLGLVDQLKITVSPVVLGGGLPLFADMKQTIDLELAEHRSFENGVLGLVYEIKKPAE